MYYTTDSQKLYVWTGAAWLAIIETFVALLACLSVTAAQPSIKRNTATTNTLPQVQASNIIAGGTIDGDRLPAMSATKLGGVPATGTPTGKVLSDAGTWITDATSVPAPVYANDFTANYTSVLDFNGATITQEFSSSRISIATTSDVQGVEFRAYALTPGVTYHLVLLIDSMTAGQVYAISDDVYAAGGAWYTGFSNAGWFGLTFTASASAQYLFFQTTVNGVACTLKLNYIGLFVSPSREFERNAYSHDIVYRYNLLNAAKYSIPTTRILLGSSQSDGGGTGSTILLGTGAAGPNTYSMAEGEPVTIGVSASTANYSSAGGWSNTGVEEGRLAMGSRAQARSWRSTALGANSLAATVSSTAVGWGAAVGQGHSFVGGRGVALTPQTPALDGEGVVGFHGQSLYLDASWAHMVPHPIDPDNFTFAQTHVPQRAAWLHGPDAYDARAGGTDADNSVVADNTARDAITAANRWPGMWVFSTASDRTYVLNIAFGSSLSANTWKDVNDCFLTAQKTTSQRKRDGTGAGAQAYIYVQSPIPLAVGTILTTAGLGNGLDGRVTLNSVAGDGGAEGSYTLGFLAPNSGTIEGWTADTDGTITINDARQMNQPAGAFNISGGRPTGSGAAGVINIQTAAGASANENTKATLVTAARFDASTTTNSGVWVATRFLLLDLQANQLVRVYANPTNDSAGTGMRTLVIPNN